MLPKQFFNQGSQSCLLFHMIIFAKSWLILSLFCLVKYLANILGWWIMASIVLIYKLTSMQYMGKKPKIKPLFGVITPLNSFFSWYLQIGCSKEKFLTFCEFRPSSLLLHVIPDWLKDLCASVRGTPSVVEVLSLSKKIVLVWGHCHAADQTFPWWMMDVK